MERENIPCTIRRTLAVQRYLLGFAPQVCASMLIEHDIFEVRPIGYHSITEYNASGNTYDLIPLFYSYFSDILRRA